MWSTTVPISMLSTCMLPPRKDPLEHRLPHRYAEVRLLEIPGLPHLVYGRLYLVQLGERMEDDEVLLRVLQVLLPHHEPLGYPLSLVRVGEPLLLDPADVEHVSIRELRLVLDDHLEIESPLDLVEVVVVHPQPLGRDQRHLRPVHREAVDERAHRPGVLEVPKQGNVQAAYPALVLPYREEVYERLGRVLVGAVPRVYHGLFREVGREARRPFFRVPDCEDLRVPRDHPYRVAEALAFLERAHLGLEIEVAHPAPQRCGLERELGARRRLEEQRGQYPPLQLRPALPAMDGVGGVEDSVHVLPIKVPD